MSESRKTFLNSSLLPFPFCPGCGHQTILEALDQALVKLKLKPEEVVIVTDIGCAGLSDKYFITNAFHGLHGRSTTYATGIKLARPDLTVIVLIGDGGFGIGGHHLINAARRNIGINVLVFNNFNYGMTGGEHSVTTPQGARTSTTPAGNLERPLDIIKSVGVNGANFAFRTSIFNQELPEIITRAIQHPGFCLVDIWELCTAYFVPHNHFTKNKLEETLEELGFETGILYENERPEYSLTYRNTMVREGNPRLFLNPPSLEPCCQSELSHQISLIIAGAAGAKIATAGTLFCQGAIYSGLQAAQRGNYPVTVKSGHSLAEITLGPKEIMNSGIEIPDVIFALFPEGLEKVRGLIDKLTAEDLLILHRDLSEVKTKAETWVLNYKPAKRWGQKIEYRALMALGVYLREQEIYPLKALKAALELKPEYAESNLSALEASRDINIHRL